MAELSERDKRALLGDNYKEVEAAQAGETGGGESKWGAIVSGAAFVALISAVVLVSNTFALAGEFNAPLEVGSGAALLLSFGAWMWARQNATSA